MLQPSSTTSDPVRNGILIGVVGALVGWVARSVLLASFKQAVVSAVKDELKARDEALDRRLMTRDENLDVRLEQMQHAIDQRFEDTNDKIDTMADRRGIPRPHRDD